MSLSQYPNNLRMLRRNARLSQQQLAEVLGCGSHTHISRYERGVLDIPNDALRHLAALFACSIDHILECDAPTHSDAREPHDATP